MYCFLSVIVISHLDLKALFKGAFDQINRAQQGCDAEAPSNPFARLEQQHAQPVDQSGSATATAFGGSSAGLPPGWRMVPSRKNPGVIVYENVYTKQVDSCNDCCSLTINSAKPKPQSCQLLVIVRQKILLIFATHSNRTPLAAVTNGANTNSTPSNTFSVSCSFPFRHFKITRHSLFQGYYRQHTLPWACNIGRGEAGVASPSCSSQRQSPSC